MATKEKKKAKRSYSLISEDRPEHNQICVILVIYRNGERAEIAKFDDTRGCFCEDPDEPTNKRQIRALMWSPATDEDVIALPTADGKVIALANTDADAEED